MTKVISENQCNLGTEEGSVSSVTSVAAKKSKFKYPLVVVPRAWYVNLDRTRTPAAHLSEKVILRDSIAEELVQEAIELQKSIADYKRKCKDYTTQYKIEIAKLNKVKASKDADTTITNYSGTKKVETFSHEYIVFGESMKQAYDLMYAVIFKNTSSLNEAIQKIFVEAFKVKNGRVNVSKVLSLCAHNVPDPDWEKAKGLIYSDSNLRTRKRYYRCSIRKGKDSNWETIHLDIARL